MNLQAIDAMSNHLTSVIDDFKSIGCSIDMQDRMIDIVKSEYPDRQYCIVEHWLWNHIVLSESELCECKNAGFFPEFVYSDAILHDTAYSHCNCIKSTLLSELVNNCIFVTATTCYILVNKGMFCTTTLNDAVDSTFQNSVNEY